MCPSFICTVYLRFRGQRVGQEGQKLLQIRMEATEGYQTLSWGSSVLFGAFGCVVVTQLDNQKHSQA